MTFLVIMSKSEIRFQGRLQISQSSKLQLSFDKNLIAAIHNYRFYEFPGNQRYFRLFYSIKLRKKKSCLLPNDLESIDEINHLSGHILLTSINNTFRSHSLTNNVLIWQGLFFAGGTT